MADSPDQYPSKPSRDTNSFPGEAEPITPDMVGPALIGHVVNRLYKVEKVLGQGGMGWVLQVLHLRLLRMEAMKIPMKEFMADAEYMQRFRREALTMACFEHPNIVQVYDVHIADSYENDISFITMEFVDGLPIDQYVILHQETLTVGGLMEILMKLARAIDKAHEKKVIHRDIKPANISIRTADLEPKLMDFGVARAEIASAYKTAYCTGGSNSSFTAAYAAPEQIMGQQVTGAADIYAFAVTIYKLLCRGFPFQAENAAGFIVAHVQLPPMPVQERNPRWPEGVNRALMRAMSKDPQQRQHFVVDLVSQIMTALKGFESVPMARMFDPNAVLPQPVVNPPTATSHGGIQSESITETNPSKGSSKAQPEGASATKSVIAFLLIIALVAALSYFVMDGKGAAFKQPQVYFPELKVRAGKTASGDVMALLPVWETPTPSPTATPSPSQSPSPSPTSSPTKTPSPSPSSAPMVVPPTTTPPPTPEPTASLTASPSPSETASPTPSPNPTPSPALTPREVTAHYAVSADVDMVSIIIIEAETIDMGRLESLYPRRSRSFLEKHRDMLNAKPANALTASALSPLVNGSAQFPYDRVQWIVESPTQALLLAGKYMEWYEASVKGTPRETTAQKLRDQITFSVVPSLFETTAMANRSLSVKGCWTIEGGAWKWDAERYSRVDARGRTDERLERIPFACFNTP